MKICMIVPFKYNWNSFSTNRAMYELLQTMGNTVEIFNKHQNCNIDYNNYDQIWLMGSGAKITTQLKKSIKSPVIAFGLSDPNLYSEEHMQNCDIYFTNDYVTYNLYKKQKKVFYNPTSCDIRYHKNLNLAKTTDILVYGIGKHKFVPERNQIINKLRHRGFKIKIFGRGWDKHIDTNSFIDGQQLVQEINKAHLVLDITNSTTAIGRRIFESSACGTPVLTYNRLDIKHMFQENKEILLYNNFHDLVQILDWALNNKDKLKQIGINAQFRCYNEHDTKHRLKNIQDKIQEITNEK